MDHEIEIVHEYDEYQENRKKNEIVEKEKCNKHKRSIKKLPKEYKGISNKVILIRKLGKYLRKCHTFGTRIDNKSSRMNVKIDEKMSRKKSFGKKKIMKTKTCKTKTKCSHVKTSQKKQSMCKEESDSDSDFVPGSLRETSK